MREAHGPVRTAALDGESAGRSFVDSFRGTCDWPVVSLQGLRAPCVRAFRIHVHGTLAFGRNFCLGRTTFSLFLGVWSYLLLSAMMTASAGLSLVLGFLGGRSRLGQVALAGVVSFGLAVVVGAGVKYWPSMAPRFLSH